ncbi:DUF4375 domain-containing protein [Bernardetia sp.]|uniref:DMP19 family protein n=1 Tax=Bernardetia sp. TaxID=1937974 RepID=UPI0025BCF27E|nr:DUF4375 domain-containing protein [Bernardetia sp.]
MKDIRQQFEDYSFKVMDKLFGENDGKLESLSQDELEVVRIWRLEADMYNGGFIQFFCNWGEGNFLETQKVLKKIGATKALEIITECELIISKCKEDERLEKLWDIPVVLKDYITEEESKKLNDLDELYWENPDDIQKLAYDTYLKK